MQQQKQRGVAEAVGRSKNGIVFFKMHQCGWLKGRKCLKQAGWFDTLQATRQHSINKWVDVATTRNQPCVL